MLLLGRNIGCSLCHLYHRIPTPSFLRTASGKAIGSIVVMCHISDLQASRKLIENWQCWDEYKKVTQQGIKRICLIAQESMHSFCCCVGRNTLQGGATRDYDGINSTKRKFDTFASEHEWKRRWLKQYRGPSRLRERGRALLDAVKISWCWEWDEQAWWATIVCAWIGRGFGMRDTIILRYSTYMLSEWPRRMVQLLAMGSCR